MTCLVIICKQSSIEKKLSINNVFSLSLSQALLPFDVDQVDFSSCFDTTRVEAKKSQIGNNLTGKLILILMSGMQRTKLNCKGGFTQQSFDD